MELIAAVESDCSLKVDEIPMNPGGGFASKFQLVSAKAMKSLRKGHAFRLVGHFAGYSAIEPCKRAVGAELYQKKGSYSCYFQPERRCEGEEKSSNSAQGAAGAALAKMKAVSKSEEAQLYHAVEAFLFRPNAATISEFQRREMSVGFDQGAMHGPLVAIHARRGDKVVDAYNRYYTSREYAEIVLNWAGKAKECQDVERECIVYVASDSAVVLGEIRNWLGSARAGACSFRVIGAEQSLTQRASDTHRFDHRDEIQGMAGKVQLMKGDEAKEAAIDILFDIYMLSRANFFVGSLTSQIGRIAAGLKIAVAYPPAVGSPPVALDYSNWRAVEGMGGGDGIPTPLAEGWVEKPQLDLRLPGTEESGPQKELVEAIAAVQQDCDRPAEDVDISQPEGAELAVLLTQAAFRAASAVRLGRRFRLRGHLGGYSESEVCKDTIGKDTFSKQGTFSCYFLQESHCPSSSPSAVAYANAALVKLQQLGAGISGDQNLFRAMAAYLFRPTEETEAEFLKREWISRIADVPSPFIGIQVHGEKAATPSARPAVGPQEYAKVLQSWAKKAPASSKGGPQRCTVFVASDGDEALAELRKLLDDKQVGQCQFTVTGLQGYWAHHHYKEGWLGKLHGKDGQWAARDILFDIRALSNADVLIGTLASPLARFAAGVRLARHAQKAAASPAIALDFSAPLVDGGVGGSGTGDAKEMLDREAWVAPPA